MLTDFNTLVPVLKLSKGRPVTTGKNTKEAKQMARVQRIQATARVLAFLREHEGERFFVSDLSIRFALPDRAIVDAARGGGSVSKYRLESVRRNGCHKAWRIWYGVSPVEQATKLEARIARWLAKPHRVMVKGKSTVLVYVSSVIAKALDEDVQAVAISLETMYRRGELARCELLMRKGVDRFEYRLMGEAR